MMFSILSIHFNVAALAFFQGTQLSLFESFLTQAISGINSTSITSGMQNVAYVVLLVGFLWQVYQASLHGGDVRGLGVSLIKYVITAVVVMNYSAIFTTVNQGFVNAGNWIGNATGFGNLLDNWKTDISTQYSQDGVQQMWGLVTGSIAGLIDGVLILVAYLLYPFVIAIFGFFYIFYGSVLYIFGPIVIALMPLGATNRLAKAYVENVFIWNAWPILYGGFGALLGAVQMGQVGQMLSQNNFLGGLGNLEGSFLIGAASIIYSLAIAVIPFIARKIVSGEVGATAGALMGAAATALTAGIAATEGVAAGVSGASSSTGSAAQGSTTSSAATSSRPSTGGQGNQPAAPQRGTPTATTKTTASSDPSGTLSSSRNNSAPATQAETVAANIRDSFNDALNPGRDSGAGPSNNGGQVVGSDDSANTPSINGPNRSASASPSGGASSGKRSAGSPTPALMRPHGLATWGAFHAARLTTRAAIGGARATGGVAKGIGSVVTNPVESAGRLGGKAGELAGHAMNLSDRAANVAGRVAQAVTRPQEAAAAGVRSATDAVGVAATSTISAVRQSTNAAREEFSEAYADTRAAHNPKGSRPD